MHSRSAHRSLLVVDSVALDDINPRMPIIRHDIQQLARLGDIYADASPDLFNFVNNGSTTAHTVHAQEKELDQALLAAAGFGATGAEIFNKGGPYLARGAKDLVPTAQTLDLNSPALFCTLRNLHDAEPKVAKSRMLKLMSPNAICLSLENVNGVWDDPVPLTVWGTRRTSLSVGASSGRYRASSRV